MVCNLSAMGVGLVGRKAAGSRKGGKTEALRLAEAERILVDRMNGMRVTELMTKYNLGSSTINSRINMAVAARINPTVDKYREMEGAYLDELASDLERTRNSAKELIRIGIERGDIVVVEKGLDNLTKSVASSLRLSERRSKLFGLDAPVKVEATVVEVTQEDLEMEELIREARTRIATEVGPAAVGTS